jgi:hypothetical protein
VATYQNTVLTAQQDVENGLVTFLRAQEQSRFQAESVEYTEKALKVALAQYRAGTIDFTRVTQLEQTLVQQLDLLAQARGQIALGLIQTYRALGGGWEIRETGCDPHPPATAAPAPEKPSPLEDILPTPRRVPGSGTEMPAPVFRLRVREPRDADGQSAVQ